MKALLHVESIKKETVAELRKTIVEILNQGRDEETVRFALKTLTKVMSNLPPITITNCTFRGGKKLSKKKR